MTLVYIDFSLFDCHHVDVLKVDPLAEELAYGDLVIDYDIAYFGTFICLVECLLVPVQLRQYCAQLHADLALEFKLYQSHRDRFIPQVHLVRPEVLQAGVQADRTLLQLPLLLIAEGHVVENLYGYHLVALAL